MQKKFEIDSCEEICFSDRLLEMYSEAIVDLKLDAKLQVTNVNKVKNIYLSIVR